MWTAVGFTSLRIEKAGQELVLEHGNIAKSHDEREQSILGAHFPKSPPRHYEQRVGCAFERVVHLIGMLLAKAANTSAPGGDRISADIIKDFSQWDKQRITQLVRAFARFEHQPKLW